MASGQAINFGDSLKQARDIILSREVARAALQLDTSRNSDFLGA